MSRVRKPKNKFVNSVLYENLVYSSSKVTHVHHESDDYYKVKSLSDWLFVKYNISYKTFKNKSKKRRDELRAEFEADTGVNLQDRLTKKDDEFDNENAWWLFI